MYKLQKNKLTAKEIAYYGLFITLVYVATRFINIPGPTPGGLFHLGNVMAFSIAIIFGEKAGAFSGAIGMTLFDVTSAYFPWAPFTFVIRFAMGYIIGSMANQQTTGRFKSIIFSLSGILIASILMIAGYYAAEVVLYGNLYGPLQSVWGNFMQCVIGTVIGLPVSISLKAILKSTKIPIQL